MEELAFIALTLAVMIGFASLAAGILSVGGGLLASDHPLAVLFGVVVAVIGLMVVGVTGYFAFTAVSLGLGYIF